MQFLQAPEDGRGQQQGVDTVEDAAVAGQQRAGILDPDRAFEAAFSQVAYLRGYFGPILVVRASNDDVIPPPNTTRLVHSLQTRPQGVEVIQLKGADHHNIGTYPEYGQALREFID